MKNEIIGFYNDGVRLEGVLRYPDHAESPVPCLLLIHGSMEHDRDGNLLQTMDGKVIPRKDFFIELSNHLCGAGIATFSWDKRGFGKSQGQPGDYFSQVQDAKAALDILNSKTSVVNKDKIAVFGQSAGVYVACLLAKEESRPCAYVLSGGLYSDYYEMMSYNYHRVRDYANKSPANRNWVEKNDLWGLVLGINLDKMFDAITRGEREIKIEYKDHVWTLPINEKVYSPELAPKKQFRYINRPTLIIHGEADLNVPVQDANKIAEELRRSGNKDIELVIIADADHSFQQVALDEDTRIRERMSLESFKNPYIESYFKSVIAFLELRFNHDIGIKQY